MRYWQQHPQIINGIFAAQEITILDDKISKQKKVDCVAFCSFESRFAQSGGLAAVTTKILPYLKEVRSVANVILLTPFYPHLGPSRKLQSAGRIEVFFDNEIHEVEILRHVQRYQQPAPGFVEEFYFKAPGFFDSKNSLNDPYIYDETDPKKNNEALQRNALFFCQCVPLAMQKLGFVNNLLFHVQDWQTILVALTAKQAIAKGTLQSGRTVCTLHNPYDSGWLKLESLAKILDTSTAQRLYRSLQDDLTALRLGLSLVDAPITTVSGNFAKELTSDILQTQHFAPHLQAIFKKNGVIGVNNGIFVDFPPELLTFAKSKKPSAISKSAIDKIKQVKLKKRAALLQILEEYNPRERFGKLTYNGRSLTEKNRVLLPEEIPLLLMSGRLDPIQKGFDILLRAVGRFKEDEVKVVLTPLPVRESDLDYFRRTAETCPGNLTVFPLRMERGFHELQIGSTFGVMPSIYEPFGAAIEYMVNGTVVVARKTGGLVDQVDNGVNGFLFREAKRHYDPVNIAQFVDSSDAVELRRDNPWCNDMVNGLHKVLKRAIRVYQKENDKYYEMALNGLLKAREFDWHSTATAYASIYEG
ncbi:MAG: glycogen/starch synthase [bacterium]